MTMVFLSLLTPLILIALCMALMALQDKYKKTPMDELQEVFTKRVTRGDVWANARAEVEKLYAEIERDWNIKNPPPEGCDGLSMALWPTHELQRRFHNGTLYHWQPYLRRQKEIQPMRKNEFDRLNEEYPGIGKSDPPFSKIAAIDVGSLVSLSALEDMESINRELDAEARKNNVVEFNRGKV